MGRAGRSGSLSGELRGRRLDSEELDRIAAFG